MSHSTNVVILVIVPALILDVLTVKFVTPTEASNADGTLLLSLALPSISLCLAVTVHLYGMITQNRTFRDRHVEAECTINHHQHLHQAVDHSRLTPPQGSAQCIRAELAVN